MKKALSRFAVLALILTLMLTALPVPALRAEETGASEPLRHFVVENANLTPAEGKVTDPSALFTATVPAGADYEITEEYWTYHTDSGAWKFLSSENNKAASITFDTFEPGVDYYYCVRLAPTNGGKVNADAGSITLSLNGKTVSLSKDNIRISDSQVWVLFNQAASYTIKNNNVVSDFAIENVNLNLSAGAPSLDIFTGKAADGADYVLATELWLEPLKSDFSDYKIYTNSASENDGIGASRLISSFEAGKTYYYGVILHAASKPLTSDKSAVSISVNGQSVTPGKVFAATAGQSLSCFFLVPVTIPGGSAGEFDGFELTATLTAAAGQAPVFTGSVPSGKGYALNYERWISEDGKSHYDTELLNGFSQAAGEYFDTFEAGKTYTYEVSFILNGKTLPADLEDVKLRLNGKDVALKSSDLVLVDSFFVIRNVYTVTVQDANVLSDFAVEGATLKLQAGAAPIANPASLSTGHAPAGADYTVLMEGWFELADDGSSKLITSDAKENEQLRSISQLLTEFKPGHTYLYSVVFTLPADKTVNPDATKLSIRVNGKQYSIASNTVYRNPELTTIAFRFLVPYTIPDGNTITNLVVEDATLSLVGGQAPKFTGRAPADADYTLLYEGWEDEYGRYLFNDKAYNATFSDAQRFTLPEAGKTYYYCLTFLMKDGSTKFFSAKDQASLTVNGKAVSLDNAPYNVTLENNLPVLNVDEAISVVASAPGESGGSISFIEPDYYPDYSEIENDAPAAAPAPATPGRDDSDTAPKTADAPIIPTLLLAALSALVLVRAKKRLCR